MKSTAAEREEALNKRLVLGAVAVMLAVGSGFSWFSSLQRQAVPMTKADLAAQDEARRQHLQADDPKKFARALEHANVLREKWRPWAEKNRALLKTMLAAKPDDTVAMNAVWDAIPPLRLKGGDSITVEDLMPDGRSQEALQSGLSFGWSAAARRNPKRLKLSTDPKQQAHEEFVWSRKEQGLRADFLAFRDVSIAGASAGTNKGIRLWASGRITQCEWIENPHPKPGEPYTVRAPDKELVPPYDFLQEAQQ